MSNHRGRVDRAERRVTEATADATRCEWARPGAGDHWCHVFMLMIRWGGIADHDYTSAQVRTPSHWQFTDASRRRVRWNGIPQPSGNTNNCKTCKLRPGDEVDMPEWANPDWLAVGCLTANEKPPTTWPDGGEVPQGD